MNDRPPNLIHLPFDPDCYRRAAALIASYSYNDADSVEALLDEDPRGTACALVVMVYSALARSSDMTGCSFTEELRDLAMAAALAAEDES